MLTWIDTEMRRRGWGNNELARQMGMSHAGVSKVLTGQNSISCEFCIGIAKAFDIPPEQVLRKAEILPPLPGPDLDRDPVLQDLVDTARRLSPGEREELAAYARWRYQRAQE